MLFRKMLARVNKPAKCVLISCKYFCKHFLLFHGHACMGYETGFSTLVCTAPKLAKNLKTVIKQNPKNLKF